ncbi:MAG: phage Gp37/Gp68 family protein [Chloroflexi bacterium]|nr:phage Gp37/Gp68 family protein [Chloroflexota bacterium]
MAINSSIEWTQATWNPVTGCTKVSPGCKHCYAERLARRLQAMGNPRYAHGFKLTLHEDLVDLPLRWQRPRTIFVNSMSDLFHESLPISFIQAVFSTMQLAHWHTFQILTKRAERLAELAPDLLWPTNVWMGVSIERQDYAWRADCLRRVPASVRFLSCEPLLGPLHLDLTGIHWVIVGGESGPDARPMGLDWARSIRDQCETLGVSFFLKQLGGVLDKRGKDRAVLDGQLWRQMPSLTPLPMSLETVAVRTS